MVMTRQQIGRTVGTTRSLARRLSPAGLAFILAGAAVLPSATINPAPVRAAGTVTLSGRVLSTSGKPVAGATVVIDGVTAYGDAGGNYSITVATATRALVIIWAPKYAERIESIPLNGITGAVDFDFSGSSALSRDNVNSEYGIKLQGIPLHLKGTALRFHGTSSTPLADKFAVTFPDGFARLYPLKRSGSTFSGTAPLPQRGTYRIELLSSVFISVMNVLAFDGTTPSLPSDGAYAPDPSGASNAALGAFGVRLINAFRSSMHIATFSGKSKLRQAAQAHTDEMVKYGYFLTHPHTGLNGSTPGKRVKATGFHARVVSEDIGNGQSMEAIVLGWLQSPFHRFNMLSNYRWVGIGVVHSGSDLYATIDFAR